MISIVNNFVTPEELELISDTITSLNLNNTWGVPSGGWAGRVINHQNLLGFGESYATDKLSSDCANLLVDIRLRVRSHILTTRTFSGNIYADTLQLVRWLPGNMQSPHADSEHVDKHAPMPHPFPWREQASVIYLNSNYEGGEVYFPQHDIELKPEPGMLATFPGTAEYIHGVRPITAGTRYTIASFWTTDKSKKDSSFQ